MRTNIEIDDQLMAEALKAGPFTTKKDAVEAGLRLLARQAAYREVARWRGQLRWEGDEAVDWVAANRVDAAAPTVQERPARYRAAATVASIPSTAPAAPVAKARRARR